MKERDIKIGNLYKQGWKAEEIAAEVKCSIGTVYNALKRLNQKTRGGIPGTKEEIKNGREFSTGDNDAKIIEIAFDKYMKAKAYRRGDSEYFIDEDDGKIANIDVNGNNSTFAISVLFGVGKGKFNDNINAKTENFNNKNRLYTFGIPRRNGIKVIKGVAKNSKGEPVDLETKHAYSVVGSSKNDLFVKNPWNSEEILTIARKDFPKLHTTIQSYESV